MAVNATRAHPYFPKYLEIPHYVPNEMGVNEIILMMIALVFVPVVILWLGMGKLRSVKGYMTKLKCAWFFASGLIHVFLEGYFSLFHRTLAGEQTFLAQTWKEYSKGDSRYLLNDSFLISMESITAFVDGPLAFIALYGFLAHRPYRYVAQMTLSSCQLYGVIMYFITEYEEDFIHSEMYHFRHFWVYFFCMNIIWFIIPLIYVIESVSHLTNAEALVDSRVASSKKKA